MSRTADPAQFESWKELFQRFEASGLTQRDFCDDEGLSLSTFGYWRRKLERAQSPAEVRFLPLDFLGVQAGEGVNLVVELPGGVVMRFSGLARRNSSTAAALESSSTARPWICARASQGWRV